MILVERIRSWYNPNQSNIIFHLCNSHCLRLHQNRWKLHRGMLIGISKCSQAEARISRVNSDERSRSRRPPPCNAWYLNAQNEAASGKCTRCMTPSITSAMIGSYNTNITVSSIIEKMNTHWLGSKVDVRWVVCNKPRHNKNLVVFQEEPSLKQFESGNII